MKDEEMAEEIANKRCHEIMCYGHCSFNSPKHHRCGAWHREYNCALEGLKAGRPQWHTPDVPTSQIHKVVLGYIKHYNSKRFCLVRRNGEWWYDAGTYNDEVKLIAWCEIPTFDKE